MRRALLALIVGLVAAVWALAQLKTADEFHALAQHMLGKETNEEVQEEWRRVS